MSEREDTIIRDVLIRGLERGGISQAEVASRLGVSPGYVCHWVQGRRSIPEHAYEVIAELFGPFTVRYRVTKEMVK